MTARPLLALIVCCGCAGSPVARPSPGIVPSLDIALEHTPTGLIVLPVSVRAGAAERRCRFILDTGASGSSMAPATRDALGIGPDAGAVARYADGTGGGGEIRIVPVDRVAVGSLEVRDLGLAVIEERDPVSGPGIDGVLGQDFLAAADLEIDFSSERLRIYPAGTARAHPALRQHLAAIPFTFAGGLMQLDVGLGGAPSVRAIFDLGATGTTASSHAARLAGLPPMTSGTEVVAMGADGRPLACTLHGPASIRLAAVELQLAELSVCDLQVYETLGLAGRPAMVLGLDLLAGRRLVIDFAHREMFLSLATA